MNHCVYTVICSGEAERQIKIWPGNDKADISIWSDIGVELKLTRRQALVLSRFILQSIEGDSAK